MKAVYVVINPELGWDNVVGIFDAGEVALDELKERFPAEEYIIRDRHVETNVDNW